MFKKYLLLSCAVAMLSACGGGKDLDYGTVIITTPTPTPEPDDVQYQYTFESEAELADWTVEWEKRGEEDSELYYHDREKALGIKPWWGQDPNHRAQDTWTGNNWDYVEAYVTMDEPMDLRSGTIYMSIFYPESQLQSPWGSPESAHHLGTQYILIDVDGNRAMLEDMGTGSGWLNSFDQGSASNKWLRSQETPVGRDGTWFNLGIEIGFEAVPDDEDAGFDLSNVVSYGVRFNFAFEKPENANPESPTFNEDLYGDGIPQHYLFIDNVAAYPYQGDGPLPTPEPPPEAPAANVIANSGLENDTVGMGASGWNAYGGDATFAVTDEDAYMGAKSFKATLTTAGGDPWGIEGGPAGIPVIPGNSYVYSAWVKGTAGATTKATVSLGQSPYTEFGNSGDVTLDGNWQNITFELEIAEDVREVRAPFHFNYDTNAGTEILIDEVRLIGPPAGNFVANSGLEDDTVGGQASGWAAYGGDATFQVIDTDAHSGSKCFEATLTTAGGDPWGIEGGPNPVSVTAGQTYLYSAWVKGTPGATTKGTVSLPDSPYTEFANSGDITITDSWQRVTFAVEIPEDVASVRMPFHFNYDSNANTVILIDDVELIGLDAPVNVVLNSGLEGDTAGGAAANWSAYGGDAEFAVSDAEAHSGNNSFLATLTTTGGDAWGIEGGPVNSEVIADKVYSYSAWVLGPVGASIQATASLPVDPYTGYAYSGETALTGAWQEITMDVTPTAAQARLPFHFNYAGNAGAMIYIDDVTLIGPKAPQTLILNGGLEEGAMTGWSGYGGTATFELNTTDTHSGGFAYQANVSGLGGNAWDIEAGPDSIPVISEQTYTFTAWVKGPVGSSVQASVSLPVNPYTGYAYSGEVALTGEWQEITMSVEIPADVNLVRGRIQMGYAGNEGVTILVDDVALKPVP